MTSIKTKTARAPRKPSNKITKADIAAYEAKQITETSEAIALMAIETLDRSVIDTMMAPIFADAAPVIETLTDEDMDIVEVMDVVESIQTQAVTLDEPQAITISGEANENTPFDAVLADIPENFVDMAVMSMAKAFDDRAAFETAKNPDNAGIQRTLKKARAQMATKRAARAMLATGFDEGQINRVKNEGSRYNVYALGKLADVLYGISGGAINNAINNAVTRSLFKFKTAGVPFTMDMAKAACSAQMRVDAAVKGILIRHTVSPSTAPTQASSTMQALVDLGIVSTSGEGRNPTFTLTSAPAVQKLEEALMKAA